MIAINKSKIGFHPRWIKYCEENNIPYKLVNCYSNDIISELSNCDALLWHYHQMNPKDLVIAKQIMYALEHTGFKVFPNFKTGWHFDDKVAQKYLFESIGAPMVESYVFFEKTRALAWVYETSFPKVFKLRGGAGSSNVKLVKNEKQAEKTINRAFGRGFSNYDAWGSLKERWRKFRLGKTGLKEPIKGLIRLYKAPDFAKVLGREVNYAYFQDFIPDNDSDIRIIVIDNKAFGLKRYVRENDFRASGSGNFSYKRKEFDERCIKISFDTTSKLQLQCAAFDFVFDLENNPLLVEVSFGFSAEGYDACPGYWDVNLNWHEGKFNPQGWMVESLLKEIETSK
jgi:glutathione synthase/RimK-type ligase-like ATP-grasp enzyme